MSIIRTVEGCDLIVRIPTLDDALNTYSSLMIHWIDPQGAKGSAVASVFSGSALEATIPGADVVAGEWYFWGSGITPSGEQRKKFAEKIVVLYEGQVEYP